MDDERINFAAIDPSRNELRWERIVDSLAVKAARDRRKRLSVQWQLLGWARPVLAVAAGLCILAWTTSLLIAKRGPDTASAQDSPALTLAQWAANNQIPEPHLVLGVLGGK